MPPEIMIRHKLIGNYQVRIKHAPSFELVWLNRFLEGISLLDAVETYPARKAKTCPITHLLLLLLPVCMCAPKAIGKRRIKEKKKDIHFFVPELWLLQKCTKMGTTTIFYDFRITLIPE